MGLEDDLKSRGVPMRIGLAQAQSTIAATLTPLKLAFERVPLIEALGRHLGEDVVIAHDVPPFAASAMDGYAIRHADLSRSSCFDLVGESRAGAAFHGAWCALNCVRISTGAPVPAGFDTVVIQENTQRFGTSIRVQEQPSLGANIRPRGDECPAGTRLLTRGERLDARRLALAATAGLDQVRVYRQPRVAVVITGDELAHPGGRRGADQIFESNGVMLASLIAESGGVAIPPTLVKDDPVELIDVLARLQKTADLILCSGGASVGDHDHLPRTLQSEGCVHFWKVRMKPGMPAVFGEFRGTPVLALPGNPVSAYVTFLKLARPALFALQALPVPIGARWRGKLRHALEKSHARAEFRRARHGFDDSGQLWIEVIGTPDSHRIQALSAASVLVAMPEGPVAWPAGSVVEVEPIGGGQT